MLRNRRRRSRNLLRTVGDHMIRHTRRFSAKVFDFYSPCHGFTPKAFKFVIGPPWCKKGFVWFCFGKNGIAVGEEGGLQLQKDERSTLLVGWSLYCWWCRPVNSLLFAGGLELDSSFAMRVNRKYYVYLCILNRLSQEWQVQIRPSFKVKVQLFVHLRLRTCCRDIMRYDVIIQKCQKCENFWGLIYEGWLSSLATQPTKIAGAAARLKKYN